MIDYNNRIFDFKFGVLFRWRGSVIPVALMLTIPSGVLSAFLTWAYKDVEEDAVFRQELGADSLRASQLWGAMVASLAFLVGFRTNRAYQRFWDGTTLLNQMWGEWFDAASCLFAFSHLARKTKPQEVRNFRHTLIRLMSLCHCSALDEISQSDHSPQGYKCLDLRGLDMATLKWLKDCKFDKDLGFNRVEVIIHMIQTLIVENQDNGVLKIPPPILSRVFQTISRGQVNLANCKKITFTLFPFPYAQLIGWMLVAFAIGTPLVMASVLEHPHWAFVFTVIPVFGLTSFNLVACELEIPFGTDDNDLPLEDFQEHMNNSMLMLIRDESDLVPSISDYAAPDMTSIKANVSTMRPKDVIAELENMPGGPPPSMVKEAKRTAEDEKRQEVKVQPPQPVAAPAPVVPVAPSNAPAATAQEHLLQNKLEALSNTFDDVMAKMGVFSSRLGQSSEAMMEFSKETQRLTKNGVKPQGGLGLTNANISAKDAVAICKSQL